MKPVSAVSLFYHDEDVLGVCFTSWPENDRRKSQGVNKMSHLRILCVSCIVSVRDNWKSY